MTKRSQYYDRESADDNTKLYRGGFALQDSEALRHDS